MPLRLPQAHLDCVLRQHGAVQLDGRQAEVLGNVAVLDSQHLVHGLALDPAAQKK